MRDVRKCLHEDVTGNQENNSESKEVTVSIPAMYLSIYDVPSSGWKLLPGSYTFMAGGSSQNLPLSDTVNLK